MTDHAPFPNAPTLRWLVAGVCYFCSASGAIVLTRFDGGLAWLWVSTAFLLGWLSVLPYSAWWPSLAACGVASYLASSLFGLGPLFGLATVPVNLAEAAVSAALLRRWLGQTNYFETIEAIVAFIVVAGVMVPMLIAFPGAAVTSVRTGASYWANWFHGFTGHALGTIAFTPLVMLVLRARRDDWRGDGNWWRVGEAIALLGLVGGVSFMVFDQSTMPLLFLPMLPMMIATMRLGRLGAAGSTVILTLIGGMLTLHHVGPIQILHSGNGLRAQFFQLYIAVAAMVVLPVAALLRQRKMLMIKLSQSESGYRLIAQHSSDAILHLATDGAILYASPSVKELLGFEPEALVGRNSVKLVAKEDRAAVVATHRQAMLHPHQSFSIEYRVRHQGGRLGWFETNTRAVLNDKGAAVGAVSAIRDVSARKATELRLSEAANTDPLTGLYNRRALMGCLEQRVAEVHAGAGHCAVAIFDLDNFKHVNDRHGHAAGDLVLQAFADLARRMLRDSDTIGRIGGEEFAIVLWNIEQDAALTVCERLRQAFGATPIAIDADTAITVTTSAGIAFVDRRTDAAQALRTADEALYQAKAVGRDCLKRAA